MRRAPLLVVALASGCMAPPAGQIGAPGYYHRGRTLVSGHVGQRTFSDTSWQPLDEQFVSGLTLAEPVHEAPWGDVWIEGTTQWSFDNETLSVGGNEERLRAQVFDLSMGVLLLPWLGGARLRPYGALGLGFRSIEYEGEELDTLVHESELTFGSYGKAGLRFDVYPGGFIGVEVRFFRGDSVRLAGGTLDTDSHQIVFVSGAGF